MPVPAQGHLMGNRGKCQAFPISPDGSRPTRSWTERRRWLARQSWSRRSWSPRKPFTRCSDLLFYLRWIRQLNQKVVFKNELPPFLKITLKHAQLSYAVWTNSSVPNYYFCKGLGQNGGRAPLWGKCVFIKWTKCGHFAITKATWEKVKNNFNKLLYWQFFRVFFALDRDKCWSRGAAWASLYSLAEAKREITAPGAGQWRREGRSGCRQRLYKLWLAA